MFSPLLFFRRFLPRFARPPFALSTSSALFGSSYSLVSLPLVVAFPLRHLRSHPSATPPSSEALTASCLQVKGAIETAARLSSGQVPLDGAGTSWEFGWRPYSEAARGYKAPKLRFGGVGHVAVLSVALPDAAAAEVKPASKGGEACQWSDERRGAKWSRWEEKKGGAGGRDRIRRSRAEEGRGGGVRLIWKWEGDFRPEDLTGGGGVGM